jgi:exopolyphosphatase/guanosine-5'-triphosphate,3'-diphosphate pyrophosphatase
MQEDTSQHLIEILNKYDKEQEHAKQVQKISLMIFDKTRDFLHEMGEKERDLLAAGALLHDIGYALALKKHNKFSASLIKDENPVGFSEEEVLIIANIARYHRGKHPKEKHKNYASLSDISKNNARKLSGICKLADALDRSHRSVVEDMECSFDSFSRTLYITLKSSISGCSKEINRAYEKKALFEDEFLVEIKFSAEKV